MAKCCQASEVLGSDLIRRRSSVWFCVHRAGSDRRRTYRVRPPVDGRPSRCVRLVATNRAAMVARRCARHHRTGQHCGTRAAGTIVTTFLFATGKRHAGLFVLTTVLSGALLNTLLKLAFARTRPDIVAPLTQVSTLSFPSGHAASSAICYLTLGLMLAQTQGSRLVRIHLINDRRDPDPVSRCQPHISRSSLSERCAGGLVLRHCVGANLPDAHVVFSAYRKDRAAE